MKFREKKKSLEHRSLWALAKRARHSIEMVLWMCAHRMNVNENLRATNQWDYCPFRFSHQKLKKIGRTNERTNGEHRHSIKKSIAVWTRLQHFCLWFFNHLSLFIITIHLPEVFIVVVVVVVWSFRSHSFFHSTVRYGPVRAHKRKIDDLMSLSLTEVCVCARFFLRHEILNV